MRRIFATACLMLALGAPALAQTEKEETELLERALYGGFDVTELVEAGLEIRGAAPLSGERVVVFLQQGREAARCVLDVAAETESCVAISGAMVEELAARKEARDAILAFFRENGCSMTMDDAFESASDAFFTARGIDRQMVSASADALTRAGALEIDDETIALVAGCDA